MDIKLECGFTRTVLDVRIITFVIVVICIQSVFVNTLFKNASCIRIMLKRINLSESCSSKESEQSDWTFSKSLQI